MRNSGPWPGENDRPSNPYDPADETYVSPEETNAKLVAANPEAKPSNPKDALGILKAPWSTVSAPVIAEVGVAMYEGARKYGRHNYRVIGVRASVYYDAVVARHLADWWEGEDIDEDSGLHHVTKAIAGLVVLRDAMIQNKFIDDRPPASPKGWLAPLNAKIKALTAKYPVAAECYTEVGEAAKRAVAAPLVPVEPEGHTFTLSQNWGSVECGRSRTWETTADERRSIKGKRVPKRWHAAMKRAARSAR
jgi:hypothetical protein